MMGVEVILVECEQRWCGGYRATGYLLEGDGHRPQLRAERERYQLFLFSRGEGK